MQIIAFHGRMRIKIRVMRLRYGVSCDWIFSNVELLFFAGGGLHQFIVQIAHAPLTLSKCCEGVATQVGLGGLCRHNFENNRYE